MKWKFSFELPSSPSKEESDQLKESQYTLEEQSPQRNYFPTTDLHKRITKQHYETVHPYNVYNSKFKKKQQQQKNLSTPTQI